MSYLFDWSFNEEKTKDDSIIPSEKDIDDFEIIEDIFED